MLSVKRRDDAEAALAAGVSDGRVLGHHVLVNAFSPVLIDATLLVGDVMLTAAALSFLGAGVAPQTTVGNAMISTSRSRRRAAPHVGLVPGVAFALTALAFRIVSATHRDVADPKGWAPRDPCTGGRFHGS